MVPVMDLRNNFLLTVTSLASMKDSTIMSMVLPDVAVAGFILIAQFTFEGSRIFTSILSNDAVARARDTKADTDKQAIKIFISD